MRIVAQILYNYDALQKLFFLSFLTPARTLYTLSLSCVMLACLYHFPSGKCTHVLFRVFRERRLRSKLRTPPHNSNPRTRFTAPLCQACKAVITRHVVSIGQTATGASSRSRLISAGDSIAHNDIASHSRRMLRERAKRTKRDSSCRGIGTYTQSSTSTLRTVHANGKGTHK